MFTYKNYKMLMTRLLKTMNEAKKILNFIYQINIWIFFKRFNFSFNKIKQNY